MVGTKNSLLTGRNLQPNWGKGGLPALYKSITSAPCPVFTPRSCSSDLQGWELPTGHECRPAAAWADPSDGSAGLIECIRGLGRGRPPGSAGRRREWRERLVADTWTLLTEWKCFLYMRIFRIILMFCWCMKENCNTASNTSTAGDGQLPVNGIK